MSDNITSARNPRSVGLRRFALVPVTEKLYCLVLQRVLGIVTLVLFDPRTSWTEEVSQ
jgi:hypothetical protein